MLTHTNKFCIITVHYSLIQQRQCLLTMDWILFVDDTSIEYTKNKEPMVSFHYHLLEPDPLHFNKQKNIPNTYAILNFLETF